MGSVNYSVTNLIHNNVNFTAWFDYIHFYYTQNTAVLQIN